ncbi:ATP-binding protein [Streptomyces phytophilus]|uniref:ATP-binding protein n=1 Tax=Streptomyces phytophilus TaxID=722715 RepID=UPI00215D88A4|nr:ATP-binding protein [Streptomyces phytophilus]
MPRSSQESARRRAIAHTAYSPDRVSVVLYACLPTESDAEPVMDALADYARARDWNVLDILHDIDRCEDLDNRRHWPTARELLVTGRASGLVAPSEIHLTTGCRESFRRWLSSVGAFFACPAEHTPGERRGAELGRAYSAILPRTEASVARARRLVTTSLRAWSLEAGNADVCLVMSELVTNAVRHARLEVVHVKVSRLGPCRVRVAVVDRSRSMPRLVRAGVGDESGRGLAAVAGCSAAWGAEAVPWGKRVWADVDVYGGGL